MTEQKETPCTGCGYPFDQGALGKYGCPNCQGDDIDSEGGMTDAEQQLRHQSEVRQIIRWRQTRGIAWAAAYLATHPRKASLEADTKTQWQRGNRGGFGDWRETEQQGELK